MFFHFASWLRPRAAGLTGKRRRAIRRLYQRNAAAARACKHFRPTLELLESRVVPSLLSTFELDGNATTGVLGTSGSTTTSHDWDQVFADAGSPTAVPGSGTFANGPTSLALAGTFVNDPVDSKSDDIFASGGANSNGIQSWDWTTNAASPSSNDIENVFAASYLDTDPTSTTFGHVFLYAGMTRFSNNGSTFAGFWFLQNPITLRPNGTFSGMHSPGDLLLGVNFSNGGSATPSVYQWVGNDASGTAQVFTPPAGSTFAIVNSAAISVPWSFTDKGGNTMPQAGECLEVGVDLTALGLNSGCYSSLLANTSSSTSITSSLTDFAFGSFSSCIAPTTATSILDAKTSQAPDGTLGESVYDTATVTGPTAPFTPTGTVTYTLTGPQLATLTVPAGWDQAGQTGLTTWTDTVTLSSCVVPSTPTTPALPAGSYQFQASYSGDNRYEGSTSPVEPLTISPGGSSTQTTILDAATNQPPSGVPGESVYDTATVTGSSAAITPTGTVTYTLSGSQLATLTVPAGWDQAGQTGLSTWTDTMTLSGGVVPNSAATPALPAGSYQFQASYTSGDGNYTGSTSPVEPLNIGTGESNTETLIVDAGTDQPPTGVLGESVFDTATVTGSPFTPAGTVTYTLTGPQLATLTVPAGWDQAGQTGLSTWTDTVTLSSGLVPDSPVTPALPAGSYQFTASYSGDRNYTGSTSALEPLTISQGNSSTQTEILDAKTNQAPTGVLGESVYDTATVTGSPAGFTPTGTVTYILNGSQLANLTAPMGWTVIGPTTWTDTVTLSGGLVPNSPATPVLPAGRYQFQASYTGDGNHTASTSSPEPLTIIRGGTDTQTAILDVATNEPPTGAVGESVYDTTTVTGSPFTPTGTVTYTLTGSQLATLTVPAGWDQAGQTGLSTWTDTVTLSGGVVPNSPATPALPAGSYQFQASYTGDSNYTGSTGPVEPLNIGADESNTETLIVDAKTKQPLSGMPPSGILGESIYDTATVTGSSLTPTGTLTYTFTGSQLTTLTVPAGWDQAGQTGLATWTDTVTLSGGLVPNSPATPGLPAGSYQFKASYSGDSNQTGSISANEPININKGSATTQTEILDAATNEAPSGVLGESVYDTTTVTGSPAAFTPTGMVAYTLTGPQLASLTAPPGWTVVNATTWTDTVTLSGGLVPNSPATPPLPAGGYQFRASYTGDNNYAGSMSPVEPLTVGPGSSSTATTILDATTNQAPAGVLGESVYDTATVTGNPAAFTPTGTVTYILNGSQLANLTAPPTWTVIGPTTWTATVSLSGGLVPHSPATPQLRAGDYVFRATYKSGDSNYTGSTGPTEPLNIGPGSSNSQTTILDAKTNQPPSGVLGESVYDTVTVTGSPFTPTGTATYTLTGSQLAKLTAPPGWTVASSTIWTATVTLNGGVAPHSPATPALPAGGYQFEVSYSGDSNYLGSTSAREPLAINQGSSATATRILDAATNQPPSGVLGESVYDTATVTGSPATFTPTGTVTYTLTGPRLATLTAPPGWTAVVPTAWKATATLGGGLVPNSPATPLLPAGSYQFQASYSGDDNFAGAVSAVEPLTISHSNSSTATKILDAATNQPPSAVLGESVYDTATVTGSPFTPTGTVIYTLTGPQLATLTAPAGWTVVTLTTWTNTVPLSGGLVPNSPATPLLPAGSYQFQASYSGDSNYNGSISAVEPLIISQGSSSTATKILDAKTNQVPSGALGELVYDTATVTGSPFTPTGTLTYTLAGPELANLTAPPGWTAVTLTTWTDTVTLSGGVVPNSPATPALPAGSYQFQANYNGDSNYASSISAVEPLTISPGSSSTQTVILDAATNQAPSGVLGESVYDTATVTGSPFTPTGSVTYTLTGSELATLTVPAGWDQDGQTGLSTWTDTVTLSGGLVPSSAATPSLPTGSYQFQASYTSGDGNYAGSTSPVEPLNVGSGSTNTETEILDVRTNQPPTGLLGESVFDTATVTGSSAAITPTGTVTYTLTGSQLANLTAPPGWTMINLTTWRDVVTLSSGLVPNSPATPALLAGSYQFQASYKSGDSNYSGSTSAVEPLTISQGSSSTQTEILDAASNQPPSGVLGESVYDTATVTGSPFTPTGTVTYTLTGPQLANLTAPAGWTVVNTTTWTDTVTLSGGLVPNSAATPALPAGSYQFQATYTSGDSNYAGSTSPVEPLKLNSGTSGTQTEILDATTNQPPSGTVGESVYDTATVTGSPAAFTPTGTVTYTLTGAQLATLNPPAGWTAVNPTTWTDTVTLSGGLVPKSPATPLLPAGDYFFRATYISGDSNYTGSISSIEPLNVGTGSSNTQTLILDAKTNQAPTGVLGESVYDTATVTGSPLTPTGTVTYTLTGPQLANLTAPPGWKVVSSTIWTDTVTLGSGQVPNSAATPLLPTGSYQFQASYSGDNNYTGSISAIEPLTISQGSSSTQTEILDAKTNQAPSGALGESVYDTATVTGNPAALTPTGTVTYTLTGPQLANLTAPPRWKVVSSTIWTDTVTLSGGLVPNSPGTPPLPAGSYQFQASYNGDSNYTGSISPVEPLDVGPGSTSTQTTILDATTNQPPSGTAGESVYDTAKVSGSPAAFTPTGSVTYIFNGSQLANLTASPGWTVIGPTTWTSTVTLSGGLVPNSPATPQLRAGDYVFQAIYKSGDSNYTGGDSPVEPLNVGPGSSNTETIILDAKTNQPPSGALGESIFDTATVTGSPFTPTGSVTYTLTGPQLANLTAPAGWTIVDPTTWTATVPLSGGLALNSPATPTLPADGYQFQASYSGDRNYTGSTSAAEPLTIHRGSSDTVTKILDSTGGAPTGMPGESVFDTATETGSPAAFTPTGTVTYEFFTNGSGSGRPVATSKVSLNSDGTVPNSEVQGPLTAGAYSFLAIYSGDGNYQGGTSAVEPLTINKASPMLTTTPNPTEIMLGGRLQDAALLTGGFALTGSITFRLYRPGVDPTTGPVAYTETVSGVNGNGTYPTTMGFVANATGTWHWVATYNGDSNNKSVSSGPLVEPVTVSEEADLVLTKVADQTQVMFGQNVTYTLTVHNLGPDTATNVFLNDPFPAGLVFVSAFPSQGIYASMSGTWFVGTLTVGATATLQLTARIDAMGPIINTAATGADQFDPNLSNNVAVEIVTGTNPESIISKRDFLASSDPPPPPAAPVALSPAGTATTTMLTFTWTPVSGAVMYDFWLRDLRSGQITSITDLAGTSYTPAQPLLVGDNYTWYAAAVSPDLQVTVWSAAQNFSIAPVAGSPSGTITNRLPTFNWTGETGVVSYWLWVTDQSTGKVVVSQQNLPGSSYTPTTALTPGDNFTWWIGAAGSGGTTTWSAGQDFSIALPAPSISGVAGTISSTTPTFGWTAVDGAGSYKFWLQDQVTGQIVSIANLSSTSYTPTQPLNPGDGYIWYAAAVSTNGLHTAWSAGQKFTIAPSATSPSGVLGTPTPTFTWTTIAGASSNTLWLQNQRTGQVTTYKNLTGTSYVPTTALTLGDTYTWYAGAITAQGKTVWSAVQTFSILPAATGPSGTIGTTTPNFSWTALTGVTLYKLWLQDQVTGQITTYTNLTATSFTPATALTLGHSYTWYAGAVTAPESTVWSAAQSFTIAPVATSPGGAISSQLPTFAWSGVTGVTSYWLWVSDQSTGAVVVSQQNLTGTSYAPATALTPGHSFVWWIGAANGNTTVWSAGKNFIVAALAAPVLSGPSGTASATNLTFSWNAVAGADHYDLWISDLTTGASPVVRNTNVTATSSTLSTTQALQSGDTYVWWVASVSANGLAEVWSQSLQFNLTP
jgi:uncharacterized repeat protein (TIGR01451 family)